MRQIPCNEASHLAELAALHRLPAIYRYHEDVEAGGLLSYGADLTPMFQRAAVYVDRVFRGEESGDLPIEQPTRYEPFVDLETAKALGITMNRRLILQAACVAMLVGPSNRLRAQGRKMPRLGVLWHAAGPEGEAETMPALASGLRDLGYVEGRNIVIEHRFVGDDYKRFEKLAAELVALDVDVLLVLTTPGALAARRATSTVPVVFVFVSDPVRAGLIDSLSRPGRNLTGISDASLDMYVKRLQLLTELRPRSDRLGMLMNPSLPPMAKAGLLAAAEEVGGRLKTSFSQVEAATPEALDGAFAEMARAGVTGLYVQRDVMFFHYSRRIAELAQRGRIATVGNAPEDAAAGFLMAYGANTAYLVRRTAIYIDKILKGANPADLPVEQPTQFELVVNLKTAKALGITVPQSILVRADRVIE